MQRYIPERKEKKARKNEGIMPGVYHSVVTSVVYPDGFAAGQAIDVTYDVYIDNQVVEYTERYLIADRSSSRTKNLEKFLDSIGADDYDEMVGLEFELTFQYEVKAHKAWCNVVDRKLLTEVEVNNGVNF